MRFLIVLGLAALSLSGCNSPPSRWESRGDRLLGIGSDRAEDPVSGAVLSKNKSFKRDYKGTTYCFESAKTVAAFDLSPEVYAIREFPFPDRHPDPDEAR